jgi:excisionase family DNA binding protein
MAGAVMTASNIVAQLNACTDSWLSFGELTKILDLSRSTLYRMTRANQIPHWRTRHMIRFDPKQVAAWYQEHEHGNADRLHMGGRKNATLGRARKEIPSRADSLQQDAR